jgi:hypothetical protein
LYFLEFHGVLLIATNYSKVFSTYCIFEEFHVVCIDGCRLQLAAENFQNFCNKVSYLTI